MKKVFKLTSVLTLGLMMAACSSTNKSAGVENGFDSGVKTSGLGSEGPFLSSAYMAKQVGVDTNTIYFNFDQSTIPAKYQPIIEANANYLKQHASAKVRLEGNTDPRGSREYNIGLGQRRASSVAQQLERRIMFRRAMNRIYFLGEWLDGLGGKSVRGCDII